MGRELGMELGLVAGQKDDLQLALLALIERGTADFCLLSAGIGVLKRERPAAAHLKAIVEDGSGVEMIDAKAGARVVDFKNLDGAAGFVLDGGVDVKGVAGGEGQKEK